MATQDGIISLKGNIDKINFYKTKDGYQARKKGGVSRDKILNDPAFQRTRENGAEFGRAGKGGRLLRTALQALLITASDSKLIPRLTKEFMKVIQADAINARGLRNVIDGEAELLQGFEFNAEGKLTMTLYAPYTASIDRVTGTLEANLDAFIPANLISAPGGATHFKINMGGTAIDFENNSFEVAIKSTEVLPWNNTLTAPINLQSQVTANNTHPIFLALGISFYQEMNGAFYPLKTVAFNSLALVKVSGL